MRHLYEVKLEIHWQHKGRRPFWDEATVFNVIANGDATKAVAKARKIAMKRTLDERDVDDGGKPGVLWTARSTRLVAVTQECEIDG